MSFFLKGRECSKGKIAASIEAGTWLNSEVLLGAIHVLYRRNAELELNGDFAFQFFLVKMLPRGSRIRAVLTLTV